MAEDNASLTETGSPVEALKSEAESDRSSGATWLRFLAKWFEDLSAEVGDVVLFGWMALKSFRQPPFRTGELLKHMEFIGNKSVAIICLTGLFTGMAMAYQIYQGFAMVNASNLVGPTVALGIFKELGPVLTGLIISARAGGAMAARLGTMRVNEQIDAMEVMGVDPLQYLVAPRVLAASLATPLLCTVFNAVALGGAYVICIQLLGMDEAVFWEKIFQWLEPRHLGEALIKSAVFGTTFSVICTYMGFHTKGGAKGVGEATNRGVVNSMVLIIVLDYFVTNLITIYFRLLDGPR